MMTTKMTREELEALRLPELQAKFAEVTGETSRSPNRKFLIRRIEEAYESMAAIEKGKAMRAEAAEAPAAEPKKERLSQLTSEQLRQRLKELTGRETSSTNHTYLVWKVSQAMKGKIPTGPRRRAPAGPHKVLPIRVPEAAVAVLDAAWSRSGFTSRQEFLTRAIGDYLKRVGEPEAAAHFELPA